MKYSNVRKGKGYCCVWCDGPYSTYKKRAGRHVKKLDKAICTKDIKKQIQDSRLAPPK